MREQPPAVGVPQLLMLLTAAWAAGVCLGVPARQATTLLAAAYGLLFLLLLPFNRWGCLLVIVAACGMERVLQIWSPFRFNTLHYATLLLLPIAYVLTRHRAQLPKPLVFWLGLCLWFGISRFWCEMVEWWQVLMVHYIGLACLTLLVRQLLTSPRRRRELGLVFAVSAMAMAAVLLVTDIPQGQRLGYADGDLDANEIGVVLGVGILMLFLSSADYGWRKMLSPVNILLFTGLGVALMLTQSRGSMLATSGALLTISLGQPRLHYRLIALTLCAVLGISLILGALRLDPMGMQKRWEETFQRKSVAKATSGRSEIARTARYMLRDHWLAGIGLGQFAYAYTEYSSLAHSAAARGGQLVAHSGYLQLSTEGGVVAVLLMAGFVLSLWVGASRLEGQRRAVARAVVVFLLLILFSTEGRDKPIWLAIGILFVWFWDNGCRSRLRSEGGLRPGDGPTGAA